MKLLNSLNKSKLKQSIIASILIALVFVSDKPIFAKNQIKSEKINSLVLPVDFPISDGNYMIRSSIPDRRYLDLNKKKNGDQCIMRGIGTTRGDVTWITKSSPPVVGVSPGFYTFKNKQFRTYLESNYQLVTSNGNRVQGWARLSWPTPRDHQEWFIRAASALVNGVQTYRISNAKDPNMCLDANTGQSNSPVLLKHNNGNNTSPNSQLFTFVKE